MCSQRYFTAVFAVAESAVDGRPGWREAGPEIDGSCWFIVCGSFTLSAAFPQPETNATSRRRAMGMCGGAMPLIVFTVAIDHKSWSGFPP
jgi:hypothetical protein